MLPSSIVFELMIQEVGSVYWQEAHFYLGINFLVSKYLNSSLYVSMNEGLLKEQMILT